MAVTFSQANNALPDISQRIAQERTRIEQAKANLATASSVLGGMPTQYSEIIAAIDAAPNTAPYTQLKAVKNALVSEFTALKAEADALVAAVNGV